MVGKVSAAPAVGGHAGVKAKSKTGKITRAPRREPGFCETAGKGLGSSLDNLLDSLLAVGKAVWEFMGRVFSTIYEWAASVVSWIGAQMKNAGGKVREALSYVRNLVSTKNVDWLKVNTYAIKILCGAAAIGVAITGGVLVGSTIGGLAVAAGATVGTAKLVSVLTCAVTAGVLAETCYTLFTAGVDKEEIAKARATAIKNSKGRRAVKAATSLVAAAT